MRKSHTGAELLELMSRSKRYRALALMTMAIVAAAREGRLELGQPGRAEDSSPDRARIEATNRSIKLELGLMRIRRKGGEERVVYTDAARAYFANDTVRANFGHSLRKATLAAVAILALEAEVSFDEEAETLVIAGPRVAERFGQRVVRLDERARSGLTERPSYTALAAIAEAMSGRVPRRGTNTRGRGGAVSEESGFEELCRALAGRIEAKAILSPRRRAALEALSMAVGRALSA